MMKITSRTWAQFFLYALVTSHQSLVTAVAWACPLCKEALFDPSGTAAQSGVVRGYAFSIAALLGVPALMIGGIAWRLARAARRR
ncbi:MAG: hypothetical protein A3B73_00525 [Omnitrophica WOR_2 bacterium RIFCSPHIGHO2_02_FULL_63_39]|nr:MAG: hypothetical protein A2Z92_02720 [Omnitrophica WOR_2 bacterium GWA2_63_20]OGX31254.1 MAG: hypothetical protein A3E56_02195 [Omnitrophica WOR_2 bacterium RIFCSPHIGHO2_12_FULL_64_13]OGX35860.1 MAG: hypothetical protein A3B73_00525 [Omnitrophica WOR_2 bacterium RIFCSPHIGHO2_02_FULL_63_39]OGX50074.1 MAG: hypothetical protein A3G88_02235 [Omnitrophica WOR_2 bacterium RIFCSPLOWO2_12_FULL_63_16]HBQ38822.1 hypothetical protein [Candidatus Omnitrophota bacterium]